MKLSGAWRTMAGALGVASVGMLVATGPASAQSPAVEAARAYTAEHAPEILAGFAELLSIPNVASDSVNIRRNARHIVGLLEQTGADARLLERSGAPPLVYGRLDAPGAERTLGIYVHYDGQPVATDLWTHAPWEPVLYSRSMEVGGEPIPFPEAGDEVDPEWRIYARSAGDDKAPIPALLAAIRALDEADIRRTSNVIFLFDGEEEAGSASLDDYIAEHRDKLDPVDIWLFCDGPVHQTGRPQLTFGVRGVTGLSVTLFGATRNLHSGHYGNWAPQPAEMLASLIASMKDPVTGEVKVAGFYDSVDPIGEEEREAMAALPAIDDDLMREMGMAWHEGPAEETLEERLLKPSLTVRGMESGGVGAEARNVIPNRATAALGLRLVRGNDPQAMLELVEAHIRDQGYHIVREEPDMETRLAHQRIALVSRGGGYRAARTDMGLPAVRQVIAAAREAAGDELVLVPSLGGTLPLYLFTDVLDRPAVVAPIANHDNNQHAPDENLRLANLWYGIELYAALLTMEE